MKNIRLKNCSGMGLTEVLVAMGIIAVIGGGLSSMMTSAMKMQRSLQAKDQQKEATVTIRELLKDPNACAKSFLGITIPNTATASVNPIKDASGTNHFVIGDKDTTGLLQFNKFAVSNFTPDVTNPLQGTADLLIGLSKVGDQIGAREIYPDLITLKVKMVAGALPTDPLTLTDCFSLAGGRGDSQWLKSGAAPSDIYYDLGKVGIGTTSPQYLFHVSGDATNQGIIGSSNSAAALGNVIQIFAEVPDIGVLNYGHNGGVAGGRLDLRTENAARLSILQANGNVGIGTTNPTVSLDVNGALRAGSSITVISCGMGQAAGEGSQRYNYTSHSMEYCNGTSWIAAGGSGCKMQRGFNAPTGNNRTDSVVFSVPFTSAPIVMATPNSGAPVAVSNITNSGFDISGQLYPAYTYNWVAYDGSCFN